MSLKIKILTESGNEIGFGHFKRCFLLHENFLKQNFESILLLDIHGEYKIPKVQGVVVSNWLSNYKSILKEISKETLIIIDSYKAKKHVFNFLIKNDKKVIVIDDYNRIDYGDVKAIINPNPYFNINFYKNQICKNIYGGEEFIILSKYFREHTFNSIPKVLNQICISIGGSDYKSILPIIIEKLKVLNNIKLIYIVGNKKQSEELKYQFKDLEIYYNISSKSIFNLFNQSNLVISGCGQTLHELYFMGKKTVGICYDYDQKLNQKYYLNNSFLKYSIKAEDLSNLLNIVRDELSNKRKIYTSNNSNGLQNINNLIENL